MRSLLHRCPDIDAVFAASDLMAVGAIQALREAGRRIPEDVAVVGSDDSFVAELAEPALTSVRQPIEEMGSEMTRLLLDSSARSDATVRRVILATSLVARASSMGGESR